MSAPLINQGVVDGSAGFGDGLTGGLTNLAREGLGVNGAVNQNSSAYTGSHTAGGVTSLTLGGGRLAYAGLAKGYSIVASSGRSASAFRSQLRVAFGGGKSLRPPNLSKYPNDAALRAAAGRTNPYVNTAGLATAGAGAKSLSGCGQ